MTPSRNGGDHTVDWADLAGRPAITYQLAICPQCHYVMVMRLPDRTIHRHIEAARAGYQPLTHCPRCRAALYRRNLPN